MTKTVTLRLKDDVYEELHEATAAERCTLSSFIEAAALAWIREGQFVGDDEMVEILSDDALLRRLKSGSKQARRHKGDIVHAADASTDRYGRVPEPPDLESRSC